MRSFVLLFVCLFSFVSSTPSENEMTVEIPASREECFFESVANNEIIDVDYQVVDGGTHNEMEINFKILKPNGIPLVADYRKSDHSHRISVEEAGDYKICFDNTISRFSSKIVFFELIIEGDDSEVVITADDMQKYFGDKTAEGALYNMQVQDIEDALTSIRDRITRTKHFQDQIRATEFRDRSIAERNFERINFWSCFQVGIMIFAGMVQVVLVRSLFDEKSSLHSLWKRLC